MAVTDKRNKQAERAKAEGGWRGGSRGPAFPLALSLNQDGTDILVYLCIITEELFEAICDTADIVYVNTAETPNVSIETEEPDIANGEAVETSYVIFDNIEYNRVGKAMWRPSGHHIERGVKHPTSGRLNIHASAWLKVTSGKGCHI